MRTIPFFAIISTLASCFALPSSVSVRPNTAIKPEAIYGTDFEGTTINASNSVDKVTGFIWANDYAHTKTIMRHDSTMLEWSVFDNSQYSIVGGFGIGEKSNLAKLKNNESYTCESYVEMTNLEKLYIDVVGDEGKWGSAIVYPDGRIVKNEGGHNLVDVSYENHILRFTFTMSFCTAEGVNGYLKFTAFNAFNAVIFLDDVSIHKAGHALTGDLENYPVGSIDTLNTAHSIFYVPNDFVDASSSIIDHESSRALDIAYLPSSTEGLSVFYFSKLGFLVKGREYSFQFDLDAINVRSLYLFYGGTWVTPSSSLKLDLTSGIVTVVGDFIQSASYSEGHVSLIFRVATTFNQNDWSQFQVVAETSQSNQATHIIVDNTQFDLVPIAEGIELDTSTVKTQYQFGESLSLDGLRVYRKMSDGTLEILDASVYSVSGFDSSIAGNAFLTVHYLTFTAKYSIQIIRTPQNLVLNTSLVKTVYAYGESLDLAGLEVSVTFEDNGPSAALTRGSILGGYTVDGGDFDGYRPGSYVITVIYQNVRATFTVSVSEPNTVDYGSVTYTETGK